MSSSLEQSTHQQQQPGHTTNSQQENLSYRKKRRLQQSQQSNGKKKRGNTRGIKWQNERNRTPGVKPSCRITTDMNRFIGEKSDQFITELGTWVRNLLPLRCRRWKDMDKTRKERLIKKIKAEWNLPEGATVDIAIENQCMILYRQWRYRLKEKFFDGFSIADALKNCPADVNSEDWKWVVEKYWGSEKQKHVSEANRSNRSKQKVMSIQGSKSTARILDCLRKNIFHTTVSQAPATQNPEVGTDGSIEATEGASEPPPPPPLLEPEYVRLWEVTKRHKDKSMDKFAEEKLEEFKQLHEEQLELYGADNLTVEEAYLRVLGSSSGYIKGLGARPKPPKSMRDRTSAYGEGDAHIATQMAEQFDQLERHSREREIQLKEQIEALQQNKVVMMEEIEKMKQDAATREERMKEREEKMEADIKEREEKMKDYVLQMMQEQVRSITSGNFQHQK